jgi:hypothetical protein
VGSINAREDMGGINMGVCILLHNNIINKFATNKYTIFEI